MTDGMSMSVGNQQKWDTLTREIRGRVEVWGAP